MSKINKSIYIEVSTEKVWELLTDLDKFHEWAPVKMRLTFEKQGLGATYHTTGKFFGMNFEIDQNCVEWEENRRWSYTMFFGKKEAKLTWILEPYQSGTKLTEIFDYELPYSFFGKLIDKLIFRRYIGKMMEKELEALKSLLEE
ncbi:MAG: SRPBCC family protein [Candidatus Hydrothermarchaeota archaeon]